MKQELDFIPFTFLSDAERAELRADFVEMRFADRAVIFAQGDLDDRVFLLIEGQVEQWVHFETHSKKIEVIEPGHHFGERAVLLGDRKRAFEARALGSVRCYALSGEAFLALLGRSPVFARAMGQILREKQNIFMAFDRFMAEVLHGVAQGRMDFSALVTRYRALQPALHPHVDDHATIDFDALAYAVRRLPAHVTRTLVWFLADELPLLYSTPQATFEAVGTPSRRRAIYEMMPGKSIVLLRDGISDLVDLLSCLCLMAVEARKIRKRIEDPAILSRLTAFLADPQAQEGAGQAEGGRKPELSLLKSLPFNADEIEGLRRLWPGQVSARLRDMALHHEDFNIDVWKRIGRHNSSQADVWTTQIAEATEELIGHRPNALPKDRRVHIISSNTHSVTNCLSTWLVQQTEAIIAWGEKIDHPLLKGSWGVRQDLAVALSRDYRTSTPSEEARRAAIDEHEGVLELSQTAFTGIRVQLFDTTGLCLRPIDPALTPPPMQSRALLVNIDYAFGQQAEEIIANLIKLFGRNLDSVNVLGKAGGLTGRRGDILMPTAFVRQTDDRFQPLNQAIDLDRLRALSHDRAIHQGPVLTVAGTLLQNRVMLNFYRHLWRCVGLEMEGSYYHRPLEEARELGFVRRDLLMRYLYYTSDLPLMADANLSGSMLAIEGIPPLYAVTREILNGIFDQERARITSPVD